MWFEGPTCEAHRLSRQRALPSWFLEHQHQCTAAGNSAEKATFLHCHIQVDRRVVSSELLHESIRPLALLAISLYLFYTRLHRLQKCIVKELF